ncbi:hypothetical protein SAMN05444156_2972 [Verrucomicrobium sp. GAS474]|uniref:hypothetical protein n=1 Tax=Verrucomicrobium sp. GAS474 TaxID=1882831 RepID=UPI00087DE114|nr:hypothetical protein [Verrucomicrobium sp. GAS474]SDU26994.1 hypothetical protein SAMN05444156_2972 [Verrucomicrobium sp. GAS474]
MTLLLFLDGHPVLRWSLGLLLLAGAGAVALAPFFPEVPAGVGKGGRRTALRLGLFLLLAFAALLTLQSPLVVHREAFNIDEAVFVSEAVTYRDVPHALPWREVDGYSGGPLIPLQLLWTVPFGLPIDYATARITVLLDMVLFLGLFWLGARRVWGERIAGLAVPPFLSLFALSLLFYASEYPCLPLCGGALWALAVLFARRSEGGKGRWAAFGLGVAVGAMLFVKLQAAPIALFLFLSGVALIGWRRQGASLWLCLCLLAGTGVPAAALLGPLAAAGRFLDFWNGYVVWAFGYVGEGAGIVARVKLILQFVLNPKIPMTLFLVQAAVVATVFLLPGWRRWGRTQWLWAAWAVGFGVFAFLAVGASGRNYHHYAIFTIPALAVGWAVVARGWEWSVDREAIPVGLVRRPVSSSFALGWLAVGTVFLLVTREALFIGLTQHHAIDMDQFGPREAAVLPRAMMWGGWVALLALAGLAWALARRGKWLGVILFAGVVAAMPHFTPFGFLAVILGTLVVVRWGRPGEGAAACLLAVVLPYAFMVHFRISEVGEVAKWKDPSIYPVAAQIRALRGDAAVPERVAVWGWYSAMSAETGLPMGTRDPGSDMAIRPGPLREMYRARFLDDVRRNRPRFLVDAVTPHAWFFADWRQERIDSFPELAAYVEAHYRLVTEIDDVRIYLLRTASARNPVFSRIERRWAWRRSPN